MAQIHRTLWFRFLLLTLLTSMAAAQLPVAEDTFVASGTTTPSGTNTNLQVIASPVNAALVKFDLSGVPAGTTGNQVTKATVKLYVNTVSLSGTLDVCQVTSPWTEASTVFTSKPTLSATPLATGVPVSTASKYIVVDITTAVQAWQNGTANNGIALLREVGQQGEHQRKPRCRIERSALIDKWDCDQRWSRRRADRWPNHHLRDDKGRASKWQYRVGRCQRPERDRHLRPWESFQRNCG